MNTTSNISSQDGGDVKPPRNKVKSQTPFTSPIAGDTAMTKMVECMVAKAEVGKGLQEVRLEELKLAREEGELRQRMLECEESIRKAERDETRQAMEVMIMTVAAFLNRTQMNNEHGFVYVIISNYLL
jgi:hypothetical protein